MTDADSLKLEEEEKETIINRCLKRQNSEKFIYNKKSKQTDEITDEEIKISDEENENKF